MTNKMEADYTEELLKAEASSNLRKEKNEDLYFEIFTSKWYLNQAIADHFPGCPQKFDESISSTIHLFAHHLTSDKHNHRFLVTYLYILEKFVGKDEKREFKAALIEAGIPLKPDWSEEARDRNRTKRKTKLLARHKLMAEERMLLLESLR